MEKFILLGCLGGLFPDILRLIKLGPDSDYQAPDYLKKGFSYFVLILQVGLGAFIVYVTNTHYVLQAIVYGYAAPQIFTSLASVVIKKAGNETGVGNLKKQSFDQSAPKGDTMEMIARFY